MSSHRLVPILFAVISLSALADQPVLDWQACYDGPDMRNDHASNIATDPLGNVYVAGTSEVSPNNPDFAVVKYDASGNELWVARYNGSANGSDIPRGIQVDANGNVYVMGASKGVDTGYDFVVVKYDAGGIELWVTRYDGWAHLDDDPWGMTMDSQGNVFVTGSSRINSVLADSDFLTIGVAPDGSLVRANTYGGPAASVGSDRAFSIAADDAGNVYVTGESSIWFFETPALAPDIVTIKYDAAGAQVWERRYDGPAHGAERAERVLVGEDGVVRVVGTTETAIGTEVAAIAYDPDGNSLWSARFAASRGEIVAVTDAAVSGNGDLYVIAPTVWYPPPDNYFTLHTEVFKADASGVLQWTAIRESDPPFRDAGFALALDARGDAFATYSTYTKTVAGPLLIYVTTAKYDSAGRELWVTASDQAINAWPTDIAVADGSIVVSGYFKTGSTGDYDFGTLHYLDATDVDDDGVPDAVDACPLVDPQGLDANCDGCPDAIGDVPAIIDALGLPGNSARGLIGSVNAAANSLATGNVDTAVNQLSALLHKLSAQSGKRIPVDDAQLLITYFQNLIATL